MTPPTQRRPAIDATSAPSAVSGVDETAAAGASVAGTAVTGFGPPAAAGEVGTLGPYRVVKELGKGGMGAVYAAIDTRLDRRLALKVMLPQFAADPASRERFLREARAAARVKHDHVVTVYEADERNGVPYIAMEYLEGYPLDEYLKKKGNPTPAQVLKLAAEIAAGLAAAHRQGLVHRDVKPGNLWLEAPAGRVKVLDFGLARPVDAEVELTKSGAIVGTPAYMSPEQARGEKVDHRTDLFSLGAVLYRLVTGRLPFQGASTMAVLIALGTEEPPPVRSLNPAVPEELAALIHQLLAKSADARPASAEEVVKRVRAMASARSAPATAAASAVPALAQVVYVPIQVTAALGANPFADLDATEVESVPAAAPAARRRAPRWHWAVVAGLAALVLAVFGGVIIIIRNRDGSETKIEVPDGATVTVKDKTGKTLAKVGPPKVTPVADDSTDRKAAEWVIVQGGFVRVGREEREIPDAADLPKERFDLTEVSLHRTAVRDEGLVQLKELKSLTKLYLHGTQVTDAGLVHLKELKSLKSLILQGTRVPDAGLVHLKGLKGLTYLHLGDTKVSDAGLVHLKELNGLTDLLLNRTAVTDAGLVHLKDFKRLEELHLWGTEVGDAGLAHLRVFKALAHLNLNESKVTDIGLAHLKDCPALTYLYLHETKMTDAGLVHLRACTRLKQLDVRRTGVAAAGVNAFHAALPSCRIEYDGGVIDAKK